ncbi:hypothetical protein M8J76_001168 [Diaphorina citri]|nr:hypothetical protein M8J75_002009 [Diaphorina citri]KAI5729303.1 hypothetical protein M8J76_001168 [Diaphorina citri]
MVAFWRPKRPPTFFERLLSHPILLFLGLALVGLVAFGVYKWYTADGESCFIVGCITNCLSKYSSGRHSGGDGNQFGGNDSGRVVDFDDDDD